MAASKLFFIFLTSLCRTGIRKTYHVSSYPGTQPIARRPIAPLLHPPYQPTHQPTFGPHRLPPPASSYTTITAGIITVTANVPSYGSTNQPSDGSPTAEPQNALLDDKPNGSNTDTA